MRVFLEKTLYFHLLEVATPTSARCGVLNTLLQSTSVLYTGNFFKARMSSTYSVQMATRAE